MPAFLVYDKGDTFGWVVLHFLKQLLVLGFVLRGELLLLRGLTVSLKLIESARIPCGFQLPL